MKDIQNITVSPNESIEKAMKVIDRGGFRCALIVTDNRRLVGIVSDGDIRRQILKGTNLNLSVKIIMNTRPIVLNEGCSLKDAKEAMIKNSVNFIPVVDQGNNLIDYLHFPNVILELEKNGELQRKKKKAYDIKNVLVIGGAGYIGSVLVRKLLKLGYKVKVLDILLYGDESIRELYLDHNFQFIQGDCRNMQDVIQSLEGMDAVIHLGEIVGDPACSLNPDFTIEVNYMATKTLAEACSYCGIQSFIFSSSCSVYGVNDKEVDESSGLNPVSLYARCKVESERAILSINDDYFNPVILRFATVYGFSYRPRFDLVINLLTAKAVKEGRIEIHGGEQWRPFVATNDVSDAIISVLKAEAGLVKKQIFNVGSNNQNYKLIDIGSLIKKACPDVTIDTKKDITDKRNYKVRFDKISKTLGFNPGSNALDEIINMRDHVLNTKDIDINDPRFSNYRTFIRYGG